MNENYNKIVSLATERNFAGINQIHSQLIAEKMRLDKFFTMYLDKFEKKMDVENTQTPIWDLYKKKLKEYGELDRTIKAAEYYSKKQYV